MVDGHNDLAYRLRSLHRSSLESFDLAVRHEEGHTDIPRLRDGGISAQFLAAYVPASYEGRGAALIALEQLELIHRIAEIYPELELARTAGDVRRIAGAGRIAILTAVEGGHALDNSLEVLHQFAQLGARYLTLTHSASTDWADSATDAARHGGLSAFGVEVVHEMNRLGMLIDISHVSDATMDHVLRVSRAPVIASHSGARAINDHPRNIPDDILRRVAEAGGVVMVVFFSGFVVAEAAEIVRDMFDLERELRARLGDDDAALEREWRAHFASQPIPRGTVAHVVDHVDHIARVAGVEHVGLGSDFDGISVTPKGLHDVSAYPAITGELVRRGYSDDEVLAILGGNVLRVLEEAELISER